MYVGQQPTLNSYDGKKKVKGIKRHEAVDKNGLLLPTMVTVAHSFMPCAVEQAELGKPLFVERGFV